MNERIGVAPSYESVFCTLQFVVRVSFRSENLIPHPSVAKEIGTTIHGQMAGTWWLHALSRGKKQDRFGGASARNP